MSFEEFVKRAKDYGYAGIELDGKRPHGNPMDLDARTRDQMRETLERAGRTRDDRIPAGEFLMGCAVRISRALPLVEMTFPKSRGCE